MRFARALLASLGASTCLVLAGTLAMATLSTVVAFSGLPGLSAGGANAAPTAVLAAAAPPSAAGRDAAAVSLARPALPRRPATSRRRAASRPALAVTATGTARPERSASSTTPPTMTTPGNDATGDLGRPPEDQGPGGATRPQAPSTPDLSPPLREVGTKLGDTVATAGDGLAETLEPISPPVATVVEGTGKVAGDTVTTATEVVVGVLDGLLGR